MCPQYLHSHNIFGENLRNVVLILRRDIESSERKHHRRRGVRKCLPPPPPPKKKKKQDVKPELMDHGLKEEYSAFEGASTPYCQPAYVKCRCPN